MRKSYYKLGAAVTAGMLVSQQANAAGANTFSTIASNVRDSIQDLPGLLTALAYMFGLLLAVLGVMKIKDHVENPGNNPLKDGAIRLAAGGALFALPMVLEAMLNTTGTGAAAVEAAKLKKVNFNVE